ncbi:hypothetical protein MTR67_038980 [Solanum verrucosum]|uniref:Uncharacterized protein n=1 Tax=Solanum verrucosum TaxID=315347 RepID=A0AAF0UG39_SOLVR|nr:hypothetical protein MTR67_038980 [Solanum verrucosum]
MALFASSVFPLPLFKSNSDPYRLFSTKKGFNLGFQKLKTRRLHRTKVAVHFAMFSENPLIGDLIATAFSGGIAFSMLRLWEETAKRGVFDQHHNGVRLGESISMCNA